MGKKIVFCGGGNMAEGIMRSLIANGAARAEDITVNEIFQTRCDYLNETYKVNAITDATEQMKDADLFFIAVNPHQVINVTPKIKETMKEGSIVLSIAAGCTVSMLEEQVGADKKVVRVMPNTLSQSGNGYSAACINANIDDDDKTFITTILDALGQTMYIDESMFNTFTAFSCSGPMWIYKTVEAMVDAGVYVGFSRADSRNMVLKNMAGVAKLLDETGDHPAARVDAMCSPGGVTIEGLKVLEETAFRGNLMKSIAAAVDKANRV